jgi:hypothetical protein
MPWSGHSDLARTDAEALLLNGPGRFSFAAGTGMGPELIAHLDRNSSSSETGRSGRFGAPTPAASSTRHIALQSS